MKKYIKGDVSIRDSFKKNMSQRGLGSHRPHGTRAGLMQTTQLGLYYKSGLFQVNASSVAAVRTLLRK